MTASFEDQLRATLRACAEIVAIETADTIWCLWDMTADGPQPGTADQGEAEDVASRLHAIREAERLTGPLALDGAPAWLRAVIDGKAPL